MDYTRLFQKCRFLVEVLTVHLVFGVCRGNKKFQSKLPRRGPRPGITDNLVGLVSQKLLESRYIIIVREFGKRKKTFLHTGAGASSDRSQPSTPSWSSG